MFTRRRCREVVFTRRRSSEVVFTRRRSSEVVFTRRWSSEVVLCFHPVASESRGLIHDTGGGIISSTPSCGVHVTTAVVTCTPGVFWIAQHEKVEYKILIYTDTLPVFRGCVPFEVVCNGYVLACWRIILCNAKVLAC